MTPGLVEGIRYDFPAGANNVEVTGAIGKLEPARYVEAISAGELGALSDSLAVDDASGFYPRAVVDVVHADGAARVILTSVDRSDHVLYFDALGGEFPAVPAGAVVRTFGAVPLRVELVANYLVGELLREEAANAAGEEHVPAGRIKRQRTDDYEIEFAAAGAGGTLPLRYTQMLSTYVKEADIRFPG